MYQQLECLTFVYLGPLLEIQQQAIESCDMVTKMRRDSNKASSSTRRHTRSDIAAISNTDRQATYGIPAGATKAGKLELVSYPERRRRHSNGFVGCLAVSMRRTQVK